MLGFIAAAVLFMATLALVARLSAREDASAAAGDAPRTLPDPGARDIYATAPGTLARAYVPSWG